MKKLRTNKGFTLVELIIVIAILAIIMLIAIPNLSGIKHEMEVSADKISAAEIGKSVRVWYTKYQVEPEFKNSVDGSKDSTVPVDNIPYKGVGLGTGLDKYAMFAADTMVALHQLPRMQSYADTTLAPTSLIDSSTKLPSTKQLYWVGITGIGTAEKIVMAIGDAAPTIDPDEKPVVTYTGEAAGFAYVEP